MKTESKLAHLAEYIFTDDSNDTKVEPREINAGDSGSDDPNSDPFNCLTDENIYDALRDEIDLIWFDDAGIRDALNIEVDKPPRAVIGKGVCKTDPPRKIERLVRALEKDARVPFEMRINAAGKQVIKTNPLGKHFSSVIGINLSPSDPHTFSEEVELVLRELEALNIDAFRLKTPDWRDSATGRRGYEVFNELIDRVRTAMRDEDFVARRRRRRERARRNYFSAKRYTAALFARYARLEVLRLDFGYRDWTRKQNGLISRTTIKQMRQDLMHLLNNRRSNRLFKDMIGYIAKIEHGTTKGFHAHVIFFFDGSKVQRDAWLAGEIGKYWSNVVTKGEGLFYNCNAHKAKYRRIGIGRIEHWQVDKRANLLLAIAYITKADQYLTVHGEGGRTFFKGVVKPSTTAGGRPRRVKST